MLITSKLHISTRKDVASVSNSKLVEVVIVKERQKKRQLSRIHSIPQGSLPRELRGVLRADDQLTLGTKQRSEPQAATRYSYHPHQVNKSADESLLRAVERINKRNSKFIR